MVVESVSRGAEVPLSRWHVLCVAACFFAVVPLPGPVIAAEAAWTQQAVSQGIVHPGRETITRIQVPVSAQGQVSGGRVTRVHVQVDYPAAAFMQTQACWAGTGYCVAVHGHRLDTQAFKGQNARGPLLIVHTLLGNRPLPAPVFVKSTAIVWYEPHAAH